MRTVWQGQLALHGGPAPFSIVASAVGEKDDVWAALPAAGSSIETSGRVKATALKDHLASLCSKQAKWSLGLACFRDSDSNRALHIKPHNLC